MGGALVTKRTGGDVISYPNIHGDIIVTADQTGAKTGSYSYHPFGQPLGALPDNSEGTLDYAWLGKHQRPLEHQTAIATIEMGARQYIPSLGRFLEVDPVEGGSANDYDYVNGDPINDFDLDGMWPKCGWCKKKAYQLRKAREAVGRAAKTVARAGLREAKAVGRAVSSTVSSKRFWAQVAAAALAGTVMAGACVASAGLGCAAAFAFTHLATSAVGYAVSTNKRQRAWGGYLDYTINPINRYRW